MINSEATKKLQHPPYLKFEEYLRGNGIKLQEVANIIGSTVSRVSRNNKGVTDYSYDEVVSLCEYFQISKELFNAKVEFDSAVELEKVLRSLFRISYIEQTGHEPINLEEEYQAKMGRLEAKPQEWKREEQEKHLENEMKKTAERHRKEENASDTYKMIDKQIWPCEVIDTLKEIQNIDGNNDVTWLMTKAFLYGTIEGTRREREKRVKKSKMPMKKEA